MMTSDFAKSSDATTTTWNKEYQNNNFFRGESVAEAIRNGLSRSSVFISEDHYVFKISELADYFNKTSNGVYKHPYTSMPFSPTEIAELKRLFAAHGLEIVDPTAAVSPSISDKTAYEVARLAIAFSVDYQTGVYKNGTLALAAFMNYYLSLSEAEKNALDNLLVEWQKPDEKTRRRTATVTKFSDMLSEINQEKICLHIAAVYFWLAALKINKAYILQTCGWPASIDTTSRYWGGIVPQSQQYQGAQRNYYNNEADETKPLLDNQPYKKGCCPIL